MKLGIIGYGRMGQTIEKLAIIRGHSIVCIVKNEQDWSRNEKNIAAADVFIEFTRPESAYENLEKLMNLSKPVVCGTTGWLDHFPYIVDKCLKNKGAFLYASNFSVGVNILFELNKQLSKWTSHLEDFEASLYEAHHIHKKDSPSGTGITLLNDLIMYNKNYEQWSEEAGPHPPDTIPVHAVREGEVFGIHEVSYQSKHDRLTIRHEALNREGFASGALMAAEWLVGRQGVFTMQDLLRLV